MDILTPNTFYIQAASTRFVRVECVAQSKGADIMGGHTSWNRSVVSVTTNNVEFSTHQDMEFRGRRVGQHSVGGV